MQIVHKSDDNNIKIIVAILAIIIGVVSFFILTKLSVVIRGIILICFLLIAFYFFYISMQGRYFFSFTKESIREIQKVIWPTRKKAMQITMIVFIFVLIMAVLLWSIDKLLEFLLYTVILSWK